MTMEVQRVFKDIFLRIYRAMEAEIIRGRKWSGARPFHMHLWHGGGRDCDIKAAAGRASDG